MYETQSGKLRGVPLFALCFALAQSGASWWPLHSGFIGKGQLGSVEKREFHFPQPLHIAELCQIILHTG